MALTKKQRDFIAAYLDSWNATKAAIAAGYSEKTAAEMGYENLRKPQIAAEINAHLAEIMPRGELITRLAARSRASLADVISLPTLEEPEPPPNDERGEFTKRMDALQRRSYYNLDLIKAQQTGGIHHIKKLKHSKYGIEIEMYDSLPAQELLGKHMQLFGGDDGILKYLDLTKLTPAQLQRLANGENPLAVLLTTDSDPGESPA